MALEHRSRVARLWRGDDDVVRIIFDPDTDLVVEDVRRHMEILSELNEGKRALIFADIRGMVSADREARTLGASAEFATHAKAIGVLVGSRISRVLGQFFVGLNRPAYPTRLFSAQDEALAWLKTL